MECKVRDITIHYEEFGTGHPILFLHGSPLDHRHMLDSFEPLFSTRAGWLRIYPDLPGMGKTRAAEWIVNQDQILEIMLEFMETVAPGERFTVAGTSYGTYLARGMVHQSGARLDGLMVNVPVVETDYAKMKLPEHKVIRENTEFLAALGPDEQDLLGILTVQSMEILQDHRNYYLPAGAIADHEFLQRLNQNFPFSFDINSLSQPFPAPTLILTGRFDHWVGYREAFTLLDNYPRGTYAVLDCAGHALSGEQKALFRALTSEWLDRVEEYIARI